MKVRLKLENSTAGMKWDIIQTISSLITCAIYVASTYDKVENAKQAELFFLGVFSLDYVLRFYCCPNRYIYPFTFNAAIDLFTILPSALDAFITSGDGEDDGTKAPTFEFMRFARILRVMRLMRAMQKSSNGGISAVEKQIATLTLTLLSIVFISAGLIQTVETINRTAEIHGEITFGEAMYFIVVTISTVGYGDISPLTNWGKAVTSGMIIVSLVVVPMELNRLAELLAMQSKFRTTYAPEIGNPHVLVIGHTSNAKSLLDFFIEFYHPDRIVCNAGGSIDTNDTPCIIMGPHEPSEEIRNLIVNPILRNKVRFIKGSVMSEEDLYRVGADQAQACFVMIDKNNPNPMKEDGSAVLRSLVLENFNPELVTFVQMIKPDNLSHLQQADVDHVLCIDQMKMSILAKTCLYPGLSTLISNMFRSSSVPDDVNESWMQEYLDGCGLEVYTTTLPPLLNGCSFTQAAETIYNVFDGKVILLGLDELMPAAEAAELFDQKQQPEADSKPPPEGFRNAVLSMSSGILQEEYQGIVTGSTPERKLARQSILQMEQTKERKTPLLVNPGSDFIMHSGLVVYVLCEEKSYAENAADEQSYFDWFQKGNKIPPPSHSLSQDLVRCHHLLHPSVTEQLMRTADDIMIDSIETLESREISRHIIVYADLHNIDIETYIKALRRSNFIPGSSSFRQIVLLMPSDRALEDVLDIARSYQEIYIAVGRNKKTKDDLMLAGILKASCCLLLAEKAIVDEMDGEGLDSVTIFRFLAIQNVLSDRSAQKDFFTMVEMISTSTITVMDSSLRMRIKSMNSQKNPRRRVSTRVTSFIDQDPVSTAGRQSVFKLIGQWGTSTLDKFNSTQSEAKRRALEMKKLKEKKRKNKSSTGTVGYALLPFYAAGYGFSNDVFDSLLCQSFFTPELIPFTEKMLGMEPESPFRSKPGVFKRHTSSSIHQVPVPETFVGSSFEQLFRFLVRNKDAIPIALYRRTKDTQYVYTGPHKHTKLRETDLVFVLAQSHSSIALEGTIGACEETGHVEFSMDSINTILNQVKREKAKREINC